MSIGAIVGRAKSALGILVDGSRDAFPLRYSKYGEVYGQPVNPTSKHVLADEGSYFVLTNPIPGTALAFAVNASSDFTKSLFLIKNNDTVGTGKRMYLDYVKILPTVAPASGTSMQLAVQVDNINRYTSGGTGPIAGVNPNMDDPSASIAQIYYGSGGAVLTTVAASTSARLVSRATPRSVIPAVLEEIVVQFGGDTSNGSSSATAAGRSATAAAPVVIGPQQWAVFNVWFPSNAITGFSYEFELSWWER